jgi:hypothetical protein
MIKKTDFVNAVFDSVRVSGGQIQPSEILNLMNLFTTAFDEVINYDEFLRLMQKISEGTAGTMLQHHQNYMDARENIHHQDVDVRE